MMNMNMMMKMKMILRSGRRKLHTIISNETIKPSSPTPSHLQTYNLSPIDTFASKTYLPMIFFYPKCTTATSEHKSTVLKNSLSQTLTQYYPFAGQMTTPTTPHIDCNDAGVQFLESQINTHLDSFLNLKQQDESFYKLFPNDLSSYTSPRNSTLVAVQLNHFACGGIGLAVSMSHIVGDGATLGSFLSHWASVARYGSIDHNQVQPFAPVFLNSNLVHNNHVPHRHHQAAPINHTNLVSRKFVFPNSKLTQLKDHIVCKSGGSVTNPSRVEVLASLLYKTAVSNCFNQSPSYPFMMVNNHHDRFAPKLPQTTVGNFVSVMVIPMRDTGESSPFLTTAVTEMKKQKMELDGIRSVEEVVDGLNCLRSKLRNGELENAANGSYWCSSMCGFPSKMLDFGWGKPVGVIPTVRSLHKNGFLLIDSVDGDGIEAWVLLEKERMDVFENDDELLSFCQSF